MLDPHSRNRSKLLVFILLVVMIVMGVFLFSNELSVLSTLESIKATHDKWVAVYLSHPSKFILKFILFNIFMAMLPVPGISMISFFGGTIFGFWPAFVYSSIATAVGNLCGFFIGRYFLQGYVHEKYGDKLIVFKQEWQKNGAMALFTMRLFPFVPSFVANLIMGVSNLHWWTFFWVSWIGRIPMVVVYAWSGVQVAKISSVRDILSPQIIVAFLLLGTLPWVLKTVIKRLRENQSGKPL